MFNPVTELTIPIKVSAEEANAEIETHPLTAEIKISKCSI